MEPAQPRATFSGARSSSDPSASTQSPGRKRDGTPTKFMSEMRFYVHMARE